MGVFTRMNDIVQANFNAMLDKAEDPQKVMRLIIQEMEETLVELRSTSAKNLAEQKEFLRKQERLAADAKMWTDKAELALRHNKEELARAALIQKQECLAEQEIVVKNLSVIVENLQLLESDAHKLSTKLLEAKQKLKILSSKEVTSTTRLKAKNMQARYDVDAAIEKFASYERKVSDLEAQVDAYDIVPSTYSLAQEIENLAQESSLDQELIKLKAKLQSDSVSTDVAQPSSSTNSSAA